MSSNTPDNQPDNPIENPTKNVVTLPVQIPKILTEETVNPPDNSPGLTVLKQDSARVLSNIPGADQVPQKEPDPVEFDYLTAENALETVSENSLVSVFFPCNRSELSLIVSSVGSLTLSLFVLIGLLKPFPALLCVLGLLVTDSLVTGRTKGWFSNTLKFWFRKRPKKSSYQRIFDRNTPKAHPHLKPVD